MTFDWDNMLDNYGSGTYTQQQADAVATLMKAAGYSIGTNYWVSPQTDPMAAMKPYQGL